MQSTGWFVVLAVYSREPVHRDRQRKGWGPLPRRTEQSPGTLVECGTMREFVQSDFVRAEG